MTDVYVESGKVLKNFTFLFIFYCTINNDVEQKASRLKSARDAYEIKISFRIH